MIGREFRFHDGGKGAALAIRVKFGSGSSRIKKVLKDGTVVVDLQGPGKDPNRELLQYLSRELGVDLQRMQIIAGHEGKNKLVSILTMGPEEIQRLILDRLS